MSLPFDKASAAPIRRQAASDIACLLLHGLTGAPARDLWFLADYLSARGISVVAPLLTGHGKTWKELELATSESWQNDALAGLDEARAMGKTVFVVGLSMGGTLTLYLGEHCPEIAGLVTINAPVYVDDPKMRLVPILRHFRKNQPKGPPDVADQDAMLPDLGFNSLEAVYQFERLMQGVRETSAWLPSRSFPSARRRTTSSHRVTRSTSWTASTAASRASLHWSVPTTAPRSIMTARELRSPSSNSSRWYEHGKSELRSSRSNWNHKTPGRAAGVLDRAERACYLRRMRRLMPSRCRVQPPKPEPRRAVLSFMVRMRSVEKMRAATVARTKNSAN